MSRLSAKNQVTIPIAMRREAGLRAGDEIQIHVVGPGRLELERVDDFVARWAGCLPSGTYPDGYVQAMRDEWER